MEIPEKIWHLMAKSLNKEATPGELDELNQLLQQDAGIQQQFELLTRIWKENGQDPDDEGNARKLILRIINKADQQAATGDDYFEPRPPRRRRRLWVGGIAILIALAGWWFFSETNSAARSILKKIPESLVVNKGSRSRYLLPDGTTVWLNAGSKLHYENDFRGTTRVVRLEGEAFFDVIKDPKRPFIVRASDIDIRVLGTAFNVKSYPEDKNVETTLYRGLVNVVRHNTKNAPAIQLKPNEKLVLPKEAANTPEELSVKQVAAPKAIPASFTIIRIDSTKQESERFETAWLYSRLEFRGDSFEELALKLERWYNVTITFTDEEVKQLRFNGSFERETVEQAFQALRAASPFTYTINENEISIGSAR